MPDAGLRRLIPRYLQISEYLIREILAGRLGDGARLPPERAMAADLDVSVGTLRKALEVMERQGMLVRVQGSGNYIRNIAEVQSIYALFRLERLDGGGLPGAEVLDVERMKKPGHLPDFGLSDEAHRIRRLRYLDDVPVSIEETWVCAAQAWQLKRETIFESLHYHYLTAFNLQLVSAVDRIGQAVVPDWAPDAFAPEIGSTCSFYNRLARSADGVDTEYSEVWFDSDKCRYVARQNSAVRMLEK
ncbi:GntR family transcriptional regulator [Pelagovum pacificum]|uniref:GntR family transcriptional regulator n=1 Tax=Pelagovum pacificum TaxID=2588711 RepID=A0A5C5GG32_9RHOB|nr:GntR family transcriptional regulator [Pelagovum pacificum]QQA44377.1 GntR family transcriptional regulator [Pelagovum pacificum]TNY32506.1 GntR family transcriptional regulator [Pelagovum pacificum]